MLRKRWIIFAIFILIAGCNRNDMPFPRCISADYFGPKPIVISAHFPSNHDAFIPDDSREVPFNGEIDDYNNGFHYNQVVKWHDTGLVTNGDDLKIRVNGKWTSWTVNNSREVSNADLQKLERLFYNTNFDSRANSERDKKILGYLPDPEFICNNYEYCPDKDGELCKYIEENKNNTTASRGAPCWFTNGNGAYLLFKRKDDGNPNDNLKIMRNPISPTVHLGYDSGEFTLKKDSDKLKDKDYKAIKIEPEWKIYVKVLDRYYLNNAGGYSFEFLSGVKNPRGDYIFDSIYKFLKETLLISLNKDGKADTNCTQNCAAAQEMFQNIAEKSSRFRSFVLSLLVLFIIISSLLFLFGMIQETKHDLLIRMTKITLIVVLISPGSFRFFYDNFFALFVTGLEGLIKAVTSFSPNSDSSRLFGFIDVMFDKFFAYSVWKKFAALWHYQMWLSSFLIPLVLVAIVLYFILCIYAFIIFISGFVGIAFLMAIMPLFLISILFSKLKSLFDGWLKFCFSFCLQSLLVLTLLSLFGALIMDTFYKQLGFTICYNKWLEVRICSLGRCIINTEYFGWTPGQVFVPYTIGNASTGYKINAGTVDDAISRAGGTVKFTGGAGYIPIPPDYKSNGFRYRDFPFFTPMPSDDHYISEDDIIVDTNCSENKKELVRLTNSLLHASRHDEIIRLVNIMYKDSDGAKAIQQAAGKATDTSVEEVIEVFLLNWGKSKELIKSFLKEHIRNDGRCQLQNIENIKKEYKDNSDYQRVKDIKNGYLVDAWGIVTLFLLSFLMFSLKKFAQEVGSSLAGGGFSIYTISSMYSQWSSNMIPGKNMLQDSIGGKLEAVGNTVATLPRRLVGGAGDLLERIPVVGTVLKHTVKVPLLSVDSAVQLTKFATSPKDNVAELEVKFYEKAFGINEKDIQHRRVDNILNYYRSALGAHLGYTLKDAVKFSWERYARDPTVKGSPTNNPLTDIKLHRQALLEKLWDYYVGHKRELLKSDLTPENEHSSNNVELDMGSGRKNETELLKKIPEHYGSERVGSSTSDHDSESAELSRGANRAKGPQLPEQTSRDGEGRSSRSETPPPSYEEATGESRPQSSEVLPENGRNEHVGLPTSDRNSENVESTMDTSRENELQSREATPEGSRNDRTGSILPLEYSDVSDSNNRDRVLTSNTLPSEPEGELQIDANNMTNDANKQRQGNTVKRFVVAPGDYGNNSDNRDNNET